jgi:hypothetical protein
VFSDQYRWLPVNLKDFDYDYPGVSSNHSSPTTSTTFEPKTRAAPLAMREWEVLIALAVVPVHMTGME